MAKTNGAKKTKVEPNQVLSEKQRRKLVKILKVLLADESLLYIKLRNYHWNIIGPYFYSLHAAFEHQFYDIADLADEIAERIRQYGDNAPGTMDEFIQTARLRETPGIYPDAWTMVGNLAADHEAIIRYLREDVDKIGAESGDVGVMDLLTGLLQRHEKMAWVLRACLEGHTVSSDD